MNTAPEPGSCDVTVDAAWLAGSAHDALVPYHDLLATAGIERGLIGPREAPRLWSRHLDNCAAVADPSLALIPPSATVTDIGSGAGLPGLVWALVRPDVRVVLIEPLQRRTTFLAEAVQDLGLTDRVEVVRAKALEAHPTGVQVVTSRAVAPLSALVEWSSAHVGPGGRIVALKGGRASTELAEARETIARSGATAARVVRIGPSVDGHPLATVVELEF